MNEQGFNTRLSGRQGVDAYPVRGPDRSEQRARQKGDAEPGGDATQDGLQRAKFEMPAYRDSAMCKHRLQPLTVGATGAQHHGLHFARSPAQGFGERRNPRRGEQTKFLAEHNLFPELRLAHRPAHKGPIDTLVQRRRDEFVGRTGAQYQVDVRIIRGKAGKQRG